MPDQSLLQDFDAPAAVLVMGATGGIGRALVTALAARAQVIDLFAVGRHATSDPALRALAIGSEGHPACRIHLLDADLLDETSLGTLAEAVRAKVPALHLIINATGLLHDDRLQPEKSLLQVSSASLQANFSVNAFGPILLAKAFLPLMRHAQPVVFASLSARVGSISDNRLGGWYGYRAAKAAQNQLLRTLAIELGRMNRRAVVLALHPGTTDTDLSKPFQARVADDKLFTPEFAARCLLQVISAHGPADSGRFYAWDGQEIAW